MLEVCKYQAMGNDMLVVDPAQFGMDLTPARARLLCDRHKGLGADGICFGPLPYLGPAQRMRFINPDGTDAEKSGNGLRIFARYLVDTGYVKRPQFEILLGGHTARVAQLDEAGTTFAIAMGPVSFAREQIPMVGQPGDVVGETIVAGEQRLEITAVNIGNPHCIIFNQPLSEILSLGPLLETDPRFPQRTNVQCITVENTHRIRIAIWERGAGHTLASGTSASATAAAAIRSGACRSPVTVEMAGGTAVAEIDASWHVTLTGSVSAIYRAALAADLAGALLDLEA